MQAYSPTKAVSYCEYGMVSSVSTSPFRFVTGYVSSTPESEYTDASINAREQTATRHINELNSNATRRLKAEHV
jgi:hypothetical protein